MKLPPFITESRDRRLIFCFLILAVTALVFWHVRSAKFVLWDDEILIYENPFYLQVNPPSLWFFWTHAYEQIYMPLTYSLWGLVAYYSRSISPAGNVVLDPAVFHTLNLALHVANALLVFILLTRILKVLFANKALTDDSIERDIVFDLAALIGTLLFAIHPLQVESVAWAAETKGLLAAFFGLATIVLFCHFLDASSDDMPRQAKSLVVLWLAATLCFICALLAKPNSVILPLLAFMLATVLWRRRSIAMLWILSPWFASALALVIATTRVQSVEMAARNVAVGLRFVVSCDALLFYFGKLLVPLNLTIKYGRTPIWLLAQPWAYLTLLAPLVIGLLVWRMREHRWLTLALGWIVISLLPNLGLVPFAFQRYSTVSDRYFYIAMIGPSLILAACLVQLSRKWPWQKMAPLLGLGAVAYGLIGCLSWRQVNVWTDTETLLTHAVTVNPGDTWSYINLGRMSFEAGDLERAANFAKQAIAVDPHSSDAYFGLGSVRRFQKRPQEAVQLYRLALKYNPLYRTARLGLGTVLAENGQETQALREFKVIVQQYPADAKAATFAGQILLQQGNLPEAEKYARQAIAADDGFAPAHLLLGLVRQRGGDNRTAIDEYAKALQLDPASTKTRLMMAEVFVHAKMRPQAVRVLQDGLRINPNDVQLRRAVARLQGQK